MDKGKPFQHLIARVCQYFIVAKIISFAIQSLQPGLVRGRWKPQEDDIIVELRSHGMKWGEIAESLPGRIGEHIRERYVNTLDPTLTKMPWTREEDAMLLQKQRELGNKWTDISKFLPGRSENAVKNRWHNAKMTQRRRMRQQAAERKRQEQQKKARQHCDVGSKSEGKLPGRSTVVGI